MSPQTSFGSIKFHIAGFGSTQTPQSSLRAKCVVCYRENKAIEEMYGYWAHLPGDLLIDIAKRLKSVEDMAAFASVCSSWKSISSTVKLKWNPAMPWLMLPKVTEDTENLEDKMSGKWTLFNPITKKLYNMELPETSGVSCWGCIDGWICTLDLDLEFHLFNPLTKARLCLPSAFTFPMIESGKANCILPGEWFRRNCIITSLTMVKTPLNNELLVFVMYNKIYVCFAKPGDSMWAALECYEEPDEDEDEDEDEDDTDGIFVESVVGFNGQILVLYEDGRLASLGKSDGFLTDQVDFIAEGYLLCKEMVDSIAEVYVPGDLGSVVSRYGHSTPVNFSLVESFGDLFLVLQYMKDPSDSIDFHAYLSRRFEVFKFIPRANHWVKWDDLGDVSLFMADHSGMAVRSSNADNCKPNCIYFMEVEYTLMGRYKKYSLGIFNLRTREMEEVSVRDDFLYETYCPFWLMPKPV